MSFGWHDYFQCPGPRRTWRLRLPAREHLALNRRMIPTGADAARAGRGPSRSATAPSTTGTRSGTRPALRPTGRGVHLDVEFDAGYPFGQLWVPPAARFACIEPMTAPANALRTGDHATATPEEPYSATFAVRPRAG